MTNFSTSGVCALGALSGAVLLAGCASQSPLTATAVPLTATVAGTGWTFSGDPAIVKPSGDLDFTNISGEINVTITLAGTVSFDPDDATALKPYDPGDQACQQKPGQPDYGGWQFGNPKFFYNRQVMTFHYNHKKNDPHGKPMPCNFYGLGAIVGGAPVSLDPMVHN